MGYSWSPANAKVKDRVASQLPCWEAWWVQCRLMGPTFGRSARSSGARGEVRQQAHEGEQEFWFSSQALLCCLIFWPHYRKEARQKNLATAILRLFLELTLGIDDLRGVGAIQLDAESAALCDRAGADGPCRCFQQWRHAAPAWAPTSMHESAVAILLSASASALACPTIAALLGKYISHLVKRVHASFETWGVMADATSIDRQLGISGKKRCRADPFLVILS